MKARDRVCADCRATIPANYAEANKTLGTDYATLKNNRVVCYPCAGKRERAEMIRHGNADLYLTSDSQGWRVSNWCGTLVFRARGMRDGKHRTPFGWRPFVRRIDAWFDGPDGFVWHAIVRGDMDLARCRRTKTVSAA